MTPLLMVVSVLYVQKCSKTLKIMNEISYCGKSTVCFFHCCFPPQYFKRIYCMIQFLIGLEIIFQWYYLRCLTLKYPNLYSEISIKVTKYLYIITEVIPGKLVLTVGNKSSKKKNSRCK